MARLTFESLGRRISEKRGSRGIREVAQEMGLSPATLSRVENGHVPDLASFQKICRWLKIDPAGMFGLPVSRDKSPAVAVHFRKGKTVDEKTARALANMILAAQRALTKTSKKNV